MSALRVLGVGADDVAHQAVADHVRVAEIAEPDPFDSGEDASTCKRPESSRLARSICVLSPVITAREFTPRRVRNIFICMPVAFCASSRITKASPKVRPRM